MLLESNFERNYQIIEKNFFKDPQGIIRAEDVEKNFGELRNFLNQIPQLNKWKIVKILGIGAEGHAYLLENDHVLKIFFNPLYINKLKDYEKIQRDLFAGRGSETDIAVFDVGRVKGKHKLFGFLEIGKTIPFKEWKHKSKKMLESIISLVQGKAIEYKHSKSPLKLNLSQIINWLKNEVYEEFPQAKKEKLLVNQLILTFAKHILSGRMLDIGRHNIGVIQKRDERPVFTFFDF